MGEEGTQRVPASLGEELWERIEPDAGNVPDLLEGTGEAGLGRLELPVGKHHHCYLQTDFVLLHTEEHTRILRLEHLQLVASCST